MHRRIRYSAERARVLVFIAMYVTIVTSTIPYDAIWQATVKCIVVVIGDCLVLLGTIYSVFLNNYYCDRVHHAHAYLFGRPCIIFCIYRTALLKKRVYKLLTMCYSSTIWLARKIRGKRGNIDV